jgi:hypothetical protein
MTGRRIGSWILERELGQGGMGSVFLARHASLSTRAAVKVLSPGLESEESFRQRFRREAELQAQLKHPNVARVLDYLEAERQWFLIVDYLDRGSLGDVLARGEKVPREQALAWTRQALAGLGHAHQKGIVHRDVKPANLLLNENDEVAVADFGIARADASPGLTTTGIAIGTPQYMSPEQILTPDRVDHRADIYSLGVVFYELLTGRKPFDSGSQFAVMQAHVAEPPPPPRTVDPGIAPELEAIVLRALAKKPADRYQDCAAMARELDQVATLLAGGRTTDLPRLAAPAGGTVRATALFEPAMVQAPAAASPADRRDRRRRSFQRQLAAGTVVVATLAAFLAFHVADQRTDPEPVAPPPAPSPAPPRPPGPTPRQEPGVATPHPPVPWSQQPSAQQPPVQQMPPQQMPPPPPPMQQSPLPPAMNAPQPPQPLGPSAPSQAMPGLPPNMPGLPAGAVPPGMTLPPPAALPERPRIAVLAAGSDPLLAGALEQEIERRLSGRYDVVDEHGDAELDELLAREGAKVSQQTLGVQLLKSGFQILVLLRVEEAERRKIEVHDISGSIKAARMRLNAYLLPANRPLGRGWTEVVEYTELSAATKARQAFVGPTADLKKSIDQEWPQLRAAATAAR